MEVLSWKPICNKYVPALTQPNLRALGMQFPCIQQVEFLSFNFQGTQIFPVK